MATGVISVSGVNGAQAPVRESAGVRARGGRGAGRRWTRAGIGALLVASVVGGGAAEAFADAPTPAPTGQAAATAQPCGESSQPCKVEEVAIGLGNAYGVALDGHGNAYTIGSVGDLWRVDLSNGQKQTVATDLGDARGLALDGQGNAYTTDHTGGKLWRVDLSNGQKQTVATDLDAAYGVALDGQGNAYTSDYTGGKLWRVDLSNGQEQTVATDLGNADGVALDGHGNAYTSNNRGDLWRVGLSNGEKKEIATDLGNAADVALDGHGNAYTTDHTGGKLRRVDLSSGEKKEVATGLGNAAGVALDGHGNAYTVNSTGGKLLRVVGAAVPSKPAAPSVSSPERGSTVGDVRPEITGKGTKGAMVEVKLKDGEALGKPVEVNGEGEWKLKPSQDLPAGEVTLTVTQSVDGKPSDPVEHAFTVKRESVKVNPSKMEQTAAGDIDGDGRADLIAKPDKNAGLYWFKSNGDGTYEQGRKIFDSWDYTQTNAGDFDGDGHTDIVAADSNGTLHLWRGNGDGTFKEKQRLTGGWEGKEQTTAKDFDGDGIADLVALDTTTGKLKLWRGTRNVSNPFDKPMTLTPWEGFTQTTGADVDGDGKADLVAATKDKDGKTVLKYWHSNGDTTGNPFIKPVTLTKWNNFRQVTAGDVTGDGKDDLIAVDGTTNQLKNWFSNGNVTGNPFEKPTVVTLETPKE